MSCLHIVRTSAYQSNELIECLALVGAGDAVLFIDDGCYNLQHHLIQQQVNVLPLDVYVTEQHLLARALSVPASMAVTQITLADVAALTFKFDNSITWQ